MSLGREIPSIVIFDSEMLNQNCDLLIWAIYHFEAGQECVLAVGDSRQKKVFAFK